MLTRTEQGRELTGMHPYLIFVMEPLEPGVFRAELSLPATRRVSTAVTALAYPVQAIAASGFPCCRCNETLDIVVVALAVAGVIFGASSSLMKTLCKRWLV